MWSNAKTKQTKCNGWPCNQWMKLTDKNILQSMQHRGHAQDNTPNAGGPLGCAPNRLSPRGSAQQMRVHRPEERMDGQRTDVAMATLDTWGREARLGKWPVAPPDLRKVSLCQFPWQAIKVASWTTYLRSEVATCEYCNTSIRTSPNLGLVLFPIAVAGSRCLSLPTHSAFDFRHASVLGHQ